MNISLQSPQAVLFDWDNTLVDTWSVIFSAINKTFEAFQMPLWTLEDAKRKAHKSARESFPILFGKEWLKANDIFYEYIFKHHLEELKILENTGELILFLKKQQIKLGVVSNKKSEMLHKEIKYLKWEHFFDAIVGAGDAMYDKPAPDPILLALKKINIEPSLKVWFVGDTIADWQAAQASNCQPIAIREKFDLDEAIPFFKDAKELLCKLNEVVGLSKVPFII